MADWEQRADGGGAAAPAASGRKRQVAGGILLGVLLLAAGGYFARMYLHYLSHEETDNAFVEGTVVQVSPRVPGHVSRVAVADNQHVTAGALLAEIDPQDYQNRVDGARAALAAAEAQQRSVAQDVASIRKTAVAAVEQARAGAEAADAAVEQARAAAEAAEAEANHAQSDWVRYENLFKTGGITAAQLDQYATQARAAAATLRAAQRRVAAAMAQAREGRAQLAGANIADERIAKAEAELARVAAEVERLKAEVRQADLDLAHTRICAPQTGTVTKKAVEAGNFVRPGQPLLGIVGDDKWVVANFKETQVERMRPGLPVRLHVDAYPELALTGRVDSIQRGTGARFSLLPAENATGNYIKVVQRVPVKIVFDGALPAAVSLSLGMSVVPEVQVRQ
ncbi:MAG: HlyD family secretion protein [Lentisphaeria bacterium]